MLRFSSRFSKMCGPGSSVGIATGYGLDGPGIESRWRARFSAPVQTGPGAHPAYCTMGTGSFPGVKSDRGVTLTPQHLLVPWSRKSTALPLLPLWAVRPVQRLNACTRVHFTLPFSKTCANRTHETQSTHKTVLQYLIRRRSTRRQTAIRLSILTKSNTRTIRQATNV